MTHQTRSYKIFRGERRYTRRSNEYPVVPQPVRDPEVWSKDKKIKKAKRKCRYNQEDVDMIINAFKMFQQSLEVDLNCKLIVGRKRLY